MLVLKLLFLMSLTIRTTPLFVRSVQYLFVLQPTYGFFLAVFGDSGNFSPTFTILSDVSF
jgi:hypothetical protein